MKKVTIFGGSGMLGKELLSSAKEKYETHSPSSKEINLISQKPVSDYNDIWVLAAAKVGGVAANTKMVADFFDENIKINVNTLSSAKNLNVKKLVSVLSTCIYPDEKYVNYPLTENQLHNGPPHDSNFGYAYAKRMLEVQSRAYRKQHGCDFICIVPNNLYGLNDNYDLNNGHVIPALIRKFYEASLNHQDVILWGDGSPIREFTFARDVAEITWWIAENYSDEEPVNVGSTDQVSIKDLANLIGRIIGFKGNIKFDSSKPMGQHKKPTSNEKLRKLGWNKSYTPLEQGLSEVINDFISKYPHHRGIKI
jgi:GDP-L-fucose synthase